MEFIRIICWEHASARKFLCGMDYSQIHQGDGIEPTWEEVLLLSVVSVTFANAAE